MIKGHFKMKIANFKVKLQKVCFNKYKQVQYLF